MELKLFDLEERVLRTKFITVITRRMTCLCGTPKRKSVIAAGAVNTKKELPNYKGQLKKKKNNRQITK